MKLANCHTLLNKLKKKKQFNFAQKSCIWDCFYNTRFEQLEKLGVTIKHWPYERSIHIVDWGHEIL